MKPSLRQVSAIVASAAIATVGSVALAVPAQAAPMSKLSIVHGIPGVPVDVYINDGAEPAIEDFQPTKLVEGLEVPRGEYRVRLTVPGQPVADAIVDVKGIEVDSPNVSVVAYLTADGTPTISAFDNDVSPIAAGQTRITVRHTAQAPAVDVRAGGQPVFRDLTNGKQVSADIAAGPIQADVVLAGTDTVAIDGIDATLAPRTNTIVYAIGSAGKDLTFIVQAVTGLPLAQEPTPPPTPGPTASPSAPADGSAGGSGDDDSLPVTGSGLTVLVSVGVLLVAGGVGMVAVRRRRRGITFIS